MKIKCLNCMSEYESELGMCPYCGFEPENQQAGAAEEAKVYCRKCGKEIADNSKFCKFCGAAITVAREVDKSELSLKETSQKKGYSRKVLIAVLALLLILFVGTGMYLFVAKTGTVQETTQDEIPVEGEELTPEEENGVSIEEETFELKEDVQTAVLETEDEQLETVYLLSMETGYDENGELSYKNEYTYDENGNMLY
ncbi:MAG: zinc ribbon domain-containing protein, partial [Lachnospiraceae bacterium]|nr:zinc ribbon domain-containing protein [Lachnospiraceae bacterium]